MKLQLYYDPWLQYYQEVEPRVRQCRESANRWQAKARHEAKKHATVLEAYQDLAKKFDALKARKPKVVERVVEKKVVEKVGDPGLQNENEALRGLVEQFREELAQRQRIIDWMKRERITSKERTGYQEEIRRLERLVHEQEIQLLAAHGAIRMVKEERRKDYESLLKLGFHPWNRPQ